MFVEKKSPVSVLRRLPGLLVIADFGFVELRFEAFILGQPEGLLQERTRLPALIAGESIRLDARSTHGRDDHVNGFQEAPPTRSDTLMEPSAKRCSATE
ncbi:hypothetical protein Poly51_31030 [Rubripirellula tenax]|uniref:Uncharacterized protein n=1 Tax=Rubripirellula tenax TaxID=2528015 RepID=A0A5C6F2W5_9BACT|nr:hypothetical protein Poly51_31030 [Rubripirellula tenax]